MKTFEEILKESTDSHVKDLNENQELVLQESKSMEDVFKDIKLKILLIMDEDEKTIVSQDFVDNENEARRIAKSKMKSGQYAKYFDIGADKKQSWYKPKKD